MCTHTQIFFFLIYFVLDISVIRFYAVNCRLSASYLILYTCENNGYYNTHFFLYIKPYDVSDYYERAE